MCCPSAAVLCGRLLASTLLCSFCYLQVIVMWCSSVVWSMLASSLLVVHIACRSFVTWLLLLHLAWMGSRSQLLSSFQHLVHWTFGLFSFWQLVFTQTREYRSRQHHAVEKAQPIQDRAEEACSCRLGVDLRVNKFSFTGGGRSRRGAETGTDRHGFLGGPAWTGTDFRLDQQR